MVEYFANFSGSADMQLFGQVRLQNGIWMNVWSACVLFLLFVICYHLARRTYMFFLRLGLEKVFSARVVLRPGYSFCAVRDVEIDIDDIVVRCQLFKPSWGLHTSFVVKKVWAKNFSWQRMQDIVKVAKAMQQQMSPSVRYFKVSWFVDEIVLENEDRRVVFENVHMMLTNSLHTLDCKRFAVESKYADLEIRNYHHDLHFNSKVPKSLKFIRPDCQVELNGMKTNVSLSRVVGFTDSNSVWRFDACPVVIGITWKGFGFSFAHSNLALNLSGTICLEFETSRILCDGLECHNQRNDFCLRVTDLCMSMSEVKVSYVMFKVKEMLFDLASHLTSLPAVIASDRANLVLQLNENELVNVTTTKYRSDGGMISFDEFRGEVVTGNVSLAGITGQKTTINKSTCAIVNESCALVYCNNEKSRRVLSLFFGFVDAHRLPIIPAASLSASRVLIEEAIEGNISILKDLRMSIDVKPMMTIEKAKPMLLSLFPKIPNIHSIRDVLSVRYSVAASELQSESLQMTVPKLNGTISFLMNEIQLQICGNIDVKACEATMNLTQVRTTDYWLWSWKIGQIKLNIDKSTYLLVNLRGDQNEFSFDEVHLDKMLPASDKPFSLSKGKNGQFVSPLYPSADPLMDMFRMRPLYTDDKQKREQKERESPFRPLPIVERKYSSQFEMDDILNRPCDHAIPFLKSPSKSKKHKKKKAGGIEPTAPRVSASRSDLLDRLVCSACKSTQQFTDLLSAFKGKLLKRRERKKRNLDITHLDGTKGEFRRFDSYGTLKIQSMKINHTTFSKAVVHYEGYEPQSIEAVQLENDLIKAISSKFVLVGQVFKAKTVIATSPEKFELDRIAGSFGKAKIGTFIFGKLSLEKLQVEAEKEFSLKAETGFIDDPLCTSNLVEVSMTHKNTWHIKIGSLITAYNTSFNFLTLGNYISSTSPMRIEVNSGKLSFYKGQEEDKNEMRFAQIDVNIGWNGEKQRQIQVEVRGPNFLECPQGGVSRRTMSMKDTAVARVKVAYDTDVIHAIKVRLPTVRLSGTTELLHVFMERFSPLVSPVNNPMFTPWLFERVFFEPFDVELTEMDQMATSFVEILKIPETEIVNTKCPLNVMIANIITTLDNTVKATKGDSDPDKDDEDITDQSISGTNKKSWLRRFKTFIAGGKNQDRV